MTSTAATEHQPSRRVVILGASNVVRGISTITETVRLAFPEPLDVLIACGHGRSYGMTSRVLGRSLPGILQCGLWDQLAAREPVSTRALITDIGNDLVYGAGASWTARWVEKCLRRLSVCCEQMVITELPMAGLMHIGPRRFNLMRSLLFPSSSFTFEQAQTQIRELNERVKQLAVDYGATVAVPRDEWYGVDPIHVRRRYWARAWREILSCWFEQHEGPTASGSLCRYMQLRRQRPLYRRLFGFDQHRTQPCCRLFENMLLSLY